MSKTYKVSDIETILQLSRTKAYELVNQNLFPVLRIGKAIRIPAEPFHNWMESQGNCDCSSDIIHNDNDKAI
jgi:excisionase family DNA binding protein